MMNLSSGQDLLNYFNKSMKMLGAVFAVCGQKQLVEEVMMNYIVYKTIPTLLLAPYLLLSYLKNDSLIFGFFVLLDAINILLLESKFPKAE
jgi:hypothetical protein